MSNRNTEGIRAHAASRAEETRARAEAAIETLKGRGERITFAAVARESGLSRSSLYSNDYVKVRIQSLKALEAAPDRASEKSRGDGSRRLTELADRVRELEEQKLMLVAQLAEMELLRMENEELKRVAKSRSTPQVPNVTIMR